MDELDRVVGDSSSSDRSLLYTAKIRYDKSAEHTLYIQTFERKDQEMLAFLFIYLLPFVRQGGITFASEWLTTVFIFTVIILSIAHTEAFHFNPVMRLFGYRFYAIRNKHGISNLLISRKELRLPDKEVETVGLAQNVYLHIGDSDA